MADDKQLDSSVQDSRPDAGSESIAHGIPTVQGRHKGAGRSRTQLGLLAFLLVGLAALGYALFSLDVLSVNAQEQDPDRKHLRAEDLTSNRTLKLPLQPLGSENYAALTDDGEQDPGPQSLNARADLTALAPYAGEVSVKPSGKLAAEPGQSPEPQTAPSGLATVRDELSLEDLKFAAPMMGKVENSSSPQLAAMQQATEDGLKLAREQGERRSSGALAEKLTPLNTAEGSVRKLLHPHLTLNKGTVVECILETRVDTSVPGMTSCIIPRDIYSSTGRVLLVERGTKVVGEYQGAVQNGLERIFMLWTEMRTPQHVVVSLNSPAADPLGGAGFNGYVDHHWFKRFGNALLFSMVADGFNYAVTAAQSKSSNSNVTYNNSEKGVNEIIKAAMEQSGNIPPTLIKNPGERVSIFVARDVDFSDVYRLTVSRETAKAQSSRSKSHAG